METYQSMQMKVHTPDGTMFVNVLDDENGQPIQVIINIGKAGSAIAAWAHALSAMITVGLRAGVKLEVYLTELSSITSDKTARTLTSKCSSGPEGVWMALVRYRKEKFRMLQDSLGELLDEEEDDERLNASINRR